MDPMPIHLHSPHDPTLDGLQANIEHLRSFCPVQTVLIAEVDGLPVVLGDCPAERAATLEWALYAREQVADYRWRMVDTGRRARFTDLPSS